MRTREDELALLVSELFDVLTSEYPTAIKFCVSQIFYEFLAIGISQTHVKLHVYSESFMTHQSSEYLKAIQLQIFFNFVPSNYLMVFVAVINGFLNGQTNH